MTTSHPVGENPRMAAWNAGTKPASHGLRCWADLWPGTVVPIFANTREAILRTRLDMEASGSERGIILWSKATDAPLECI